MYNSTEIIDFINSSINRYVEIFSKLHKEIYGDVYGEMLQQSKEDIIIGILGAMPADDETTKEVVYYCQEYHNYKTN